MTLKKVVLLLLTLAAIIYVPYIGAAILFHGHIPDPYFIFPPDKIEKPGSNLIMIGGTSLVFLVIGLLYFFPRLFGFKKAQPTEPIDIKRKALPLWFWIGLAAWGITIILFIGKFSQPEWWLDWGFIPLCWGFTLMLDGLIYSINDGQSMLKTRPTELVALAIMSISGWFIFEYLNFFIRHNWYYPAATLQSTHDKFLLYAVVGSSAFMPLAFEWYQLLRKWKILDTKYKYGPKIRFPKWFSIALFVACIVGQLITPLHPDKLFFVLWLVPVVMLAIVLEALDIWTPFTPIKERGDWSALLIFALTFFIQGFLLEWWNYISAVHLPGGEIKTFNPAYWQYCIPYVSVAHIFEMPLLGYGGYLLFSIHCWLWWILFSHLMGIKGEFVMHDDFK